jgi:hypothetical protein
MRLLTAVVLIAALGCARRAPDSTGGDSSELREYYPLAVGNRWTYEMDFMGSPREQTVEITSQRGGYFQDTQNGQLAVDAYGLRDQKRYLLRHPLEVGKGWTNVVSVSSVERYQITGVQVPCEAPAGKFDDCVQVESRNRVNDKTTLLNEMTFARGVGLVTVKVTALVAGKKIPQVETRLKSFSLKTPPKDGAP